MKVKTERATTVIDGQFDEFEIKLHQNDPSVVPHMYRSQIYSQEELAVVREYWANAVDEHNTHGISRPVEVTITDDAFIVRDFALGLPRNLVEEVFFMFDNSTKDQNEHGGFGIGSKAGHAYGDCFYVRSFHGGQMTEYMGVLEDKGYQYPMGVVKVLQTVDSNETGIEVEVPIKGGDRNKFERAINKIAKFSKTEFLLNGELVGGGKNYPQGTLVIGDRFLLTPSGSNYGGDVFVRLGDLVYPSTKDIGKLGRKSYDLTILSDDVNACSLPPSRESVKEDNHTVSFLEAKIKSFEGHWENYVKDLFTKAQTVYEKADLIQTFGSVFNTFPRQDYSLATIFKIAESAQIHRTDLNYGEKRKYADLYEFPLKEEDCSVARHNYVFYWTKYAKKRLADFAKHNSDFGSKVVFIKFPTKAHAEAVVSKFGIPSDKYALEDEIEIPKTQYSKGSLPDLKVKREGGGFSSYYVDNYHTTDIEDIEDDFDGEVVYCVSVRNKVKLDDRVKERAQFAKVLIIPKSRERMIPDNWIEVSDWVEQKTNEAEEFIKNNFNLCVKYRNLKRNKSLISKYLRCKGFKGRVAEPPKIPVEVTRFWGKGPSLEKVEEQVKKIEKDLDNRMDTWQYRTMLSVMDVLSDADVEKVREKIFN